MPTPTYDLDGGLKDVLDDATPMGTSSAHLGKVVPKEVAAAYIVEVQVLPVSQAKTRRFGNAALTTAGY